MLVAYFTVVLGLENDTYAASDVVSAPVGFIFHESDALIIALCKKDVIGNLLGREIPSLASVGEQELPYFWIKAI